MASDTAMINLVLQIVILTILFGSLFLKQKRKYFMHGTTMLVAVLLNLASFLLVMLPSLLDLEIIRTQLFHTVSLATFGHAGLGLITMILGIWLVISWHLQVSTQKCAKGKKLMRLTLMLWLLTVLLGFLLYAYLYTNIMP